MNGLPWDFTRCTGQRCEKRRQCLRYTKHPANDEIPANRPISIAEFSDHDGSCRDNRFIPERSDDAQGKEADPPEALQA